MRISLSLESLYTWVWWRHHFPRLSFSVWWAWPPSLPPEHLHLHLPLALSLLFPQNKPIYLFSTWLSMRLIMIPSLSVFRPSVKDNSGSTSRTYNPLSRSLQCWFLAWPECSMASTELCLETTLSRKISTDHPVCKAQPPSLSICTLIILPILQVWSMD